MLDRNTLLELFDYNPISGNLFWKKKISNLKVGDKAGYLNNMGYIRVGIKGKQYPAQCIIWTMLKGDIPHGYIIDHINLNKADNRIENLRLATYTENQINTSKRTSSSPYKGVSFHKARNKWNAKINIEGKRFHLGYYDTPEEAHSAYCYMGKEIYGEYFNGGTLNEEANRDQFRGE